MESGGEVEHEVIIDILHWLFEAQDDDVITKVLGLGSSDIQVHTQFLRTSFDCFVLGYCVSHSNCTWRIDNIEDERVEMFFQGAMEEETHWRNS